LSVVIIVILLFYVADFVDGYGEVEFLNALVVPLRDSSGVTFMKGVDGFPAFSFASTANVQRPASELVYRIGPDFALVASILPFSAAGGSDSCLVQRNGISDISCH